MSPVIHFTKVKAPHGWMSNMSPHPLHAAGKTWRTAEALFQAMRFQEEATQEEIRRQTSPMAAKFIAKKHKSEMSVLPQSDLDLAQMEHILWLKLEQHPKLQDMLLATGDAEIVEDATRRPRASGLFWGAAWQNERWVGRNVLGKLWMKLRDELRLKRRLEPIGDLVVAQ